MSLLSRPVGPVVLKLRAALARAGTGVDQRVSLERARSKREVALEPRGTGNRARRAMRLSIAMAATFGAWLTLTTVPAFGASAPAVVSTAVSTVDRTSAEFTAQVNPESAPTTYHFEYGTSSSYGSLVPSTDAAAGSGSSVVSVLQPVTGLAPDTTYHFRVVATNNGGTADGPDQTFTTYPSPGTQSCANAQFRPGAGAGLPDCRAYEQISPLDKNGSDIALGGQSVMPTGDGITYASFGVFAGNPAGPVTNQYLSSRGASGWSTQGISPPRPTSPQSDINSGAYVGFAPDLSHMVAMNWGSGAFGLYLRQPDGSFGAVVNGIGTFAPTFAGASSDYSHILVESPDALTPSAAGVTGTKLYEWTAGQLSLASVLPGGTASTGIAGSFVIFAGSAVHAISADGSRVFWQPGQTQPIYLNQGGTTTAISASQCTSNTNCAVGNGNGTYWAASSDGSKAFFTSSQELTNDANTGSGQDLYEYDVASGQLTDLSPDRTDSNGASVQGVVGTSDDGSYVYFVATGNLAAGAVAGQDNLYVRHGGTTAFIGALAAGDSADWTDSTASTKSHSAQVSAGGSVLLFTSTASLSPGYDNAGHNELYLYDAGSGKLTCVSCNPSGEAAAGEATLQPEAQGSGYSGPIDNFPQIPAFTNMSGDGSRVFFESTDTLLPEDTNGLSNVYEWEANGAGSCQRSAGCLYLISSGHSDAASYFAATTPTGSDAFFLTREQLVAQDTDQNVDIYDARVGGGFPPPATPPPACSGDACKGQPTGAPVTPYPASLSFTGRGNVTPSKNGGRASFSISAITGAALKRFASTGKLTLAVKISGGGTVAVKAAARLAGKTWTVASNSSRSARGATLRLALVLSRGAWRQLARTQRLKLTITVTYSRVKGAKHATVTLHH